MEELKELISAIAGIPNLAVWVIVAYLAYKVVVVGSIYGLLRFTVMKMHDWAVTYKTRREQVQVEVILDGVAVTTSKQALVGQLRRIAAICNENVSLTRNDRMYNDSVEWLRQAIDLKIKHDEEKANATK